MFCSEGIDAHKELFQFLTYFMTLVWSSMNFKSKFKDAFAILNTCGRSIHFGKGIHEFQAEIGECLLRVE